MMGDLEVIDAAKQVNCRKFLEKRFGKDFEKVMVNCDQE